MKSRELVKQTLEFNNTTGKVPRHKWLLKWAELQYPEFLEELQKKYPDDIAGAPEAYIEEPLVQGDPFAVGVYKDAWGCEFINVQEGIIGEVKRPLILDEEWEDAENVRLPKELLTVDREKVNAFCAGTDKFVLSALSPRPFERLQFLRGTEDFYADLIYRPKGMLRFMGRLHDFYCEMLEQWAKTDVDAIKFMDDWGAQNSMLIDAKTWRSLFKPMYQDYTAIARKHHKKIFMHSDGYILPILPDLIEIGVDALNCQVFCMEPEKLKAFAGQITFWGEIDRQHLLPQGSLEEIRNAVERLREAFWKNGGAIAQCEFGPGAKPENVEEVFRTWERTV